MGVGKCVGVWGAVGKCWGRCGKACWDVGGDVGKCWGMCRGCVEVLRKMWGLWRNVVRGVGFPMPPPHFPTSFFTSPTLQHTFPHLFQHFPTPLHSPTHFPTPPPHPNTLSHTPLTSPNTSTTPQHTSLHTSPNTYPHLPPKKSDQTMYIGKFSACWRVSRINLWFVWLVKDTSFYAYQSLCKKQTSVNDKYFPDYLGNIFLIYDFHAKQSCTPNPNYKIRISSVFFRFRIGL